MRSRLAARPSVCGNQSRPTSTPMAISTSTTFKKTVELRFMPHTSSSIHQAYPNAKYIVSQYIIIVISCWRAGNTDVSCGQLAGLANRPDHLPSLEGARVASPRAQHAYRAETGDRHGPQ